LPIDLVMTWIWIWLWILLAASALAQTAASPAAGKSPSTTAPAPAAAPAPRAQPPPAPPPSAAAVRNSIQKQRQAVRRQAELLGNWMLPFDGPLYVDTPCDPIQDAAVTPLIDSAAQSQRVEAKLLRAVIDQESGFHPCAVSSRGAEGLMQLMPQTTSEFSVRDPFDPRENIDAGARYLKQLLDRYNGDLPQALAAYNAGPARVDEAGGIPDIPETRDYVESIIAKLKSKDLEAPKSPIPKPVKN
jgi:soluble lytic murein transglycosylase-like protein